MQAMRQAGQVVFHLLKRFYNDGVSSRAAALVYTTLLSLVPVAMVCVTIFSKIPWFRGMGQAVKNFVVANFVSGSADAILDQMTHFVRNLDRLSWTNVIFLFITSVILVYNMSAAFNEIWDHHVDTHYIRSFLIYMVIVILTPIFLGVGIIISAYLFSLKWIVDVGNFPYVKSGGLLVAPFLLSFATFTLFNWILPRCKVPFKSAVMGGLITALLFEGAKHGFAVYLEMMPTYHLIYGALAAIPIFLLWLYICWMIILFGAMVAHVTKTGVPDR